MQTERTVKGRRRPQRDPELGGESQHRGNQGESQLNTTPCPSRISRDPERIVNDLDQRFRIEEIAFDPYGATEMVAQLMDHGLKMVEFRQTIQAFNEPTQKLEALVASGRIEHGGHPVLRAHAQATTVKVDVKENLRPVRDRNTGRIDGIVALIMALSRAMRHEQNQRVYATLGVWTVEW